MKRGDLVVVNLFGEWDAHPVPKQKSLFTRHNLMGVIIDDTNPPDCWPKMYKVYIISEDRQYLVHEDDIKCIVS